MGGSKTQTSSQTTNPWAAQAPYLQDAFQQAQNVNNQGASNVYGGPQVAQFTPDQLNTFNQMIGYGSNTGAASGTTAAGAASAASGASGIQAALSQLGAFKPQGGTQSNIDAAGQYADNPYISGQVDAAMRDSTRNASENVLPQLGRNAAATGNLNSNRTAISQGIVQRGLQDQAGDISANLRGQAYSNGLNLAEQGRQADNNSMLSALQSQGSLGTSALSSGAGAVGTGVSSAAGLFGLAAGGGAGQQAADQAAIDNNKSTSEYSADRLNQLLQQYYGVVGSQNWGGTSNGTATVQNNPGLFDYIGLAANIGGKLIPGA